MDDEMSDPVAAYFEKLPQLHKRQFAQQASGASFYFQKRLTLACELASASAGRLLDCAAGTGEITCALLKSGRFSHATIVDISAAMLQRAKELVSSRITNTELEFVHSDVFNFKPPDSAFDLILCLGLIAHVGRLHILLPHLKSMLAPGGRIILQTTLTDHVGTRIVRALTARRELARRGYRISWFRGRTFNSKRGCKSGRAGMERMRFTCSLQTMTTEKCRMQERSKGDGVSVVEHSRRF
ncbi:MAG: hypothetical protein DMF12_03480 [Verrucomicrobia bacterium]|nr:MAG: hypothetical protein DMF12_03480 [Verrucomicrobiota bacterium]